MDYFLSFMLDVVFVLLPEHYVALCLLVYKDMLNTKETNIDSLSSVPV